MPEDKVTIAAISDHFSFFSTTLKVTYCLITHSRTLINRAADLPRDLEIFSFSFAPGDPVSVCAMGALNIKGNESRLSDWLLRLRPNTHP